MPSFYAKCWAAKSDDPDSTGQRTAGPAKTRASSSRPAIVGPLSLRRTDVHAAPPTSRVLLDYLHRASVPAHERSANGSESLRAANPICPPNFCFARSACRSRRTHFPPGAPFGFLFDRSEERRVGKECICRWAACHEDNMEDDLWPATSR